MAVVLCGVVVLWLYGCVVLWLYGCVVLLWCCHIRFLTRSQVICSPGESRVGVYSWSGCNMEFVTV